MSGYTLGDSTGATLGESAGGTLGTAPVGYALGGGLLGRLQSEVATYRTLTLSVRATTATRNARAQPAKTDENQIATLPTDDGGFTTLDRAGGSNTFKLAVPNRRQPLRQSGTYYVARYEEDLVSAAVDEWDITLELIRDGHRTDGPSLPVAQQVDGASAESGTLSAPSGFTLGNSGGTTLGSGPFAQVPSDYWGLATRLGTIATDRVDARFLGTGRGGVERFEIEMRPTFDQAHLLEAAFARLDGARIRQVDENTNRAVDETAKNTNTVTIDPPTSDTVVEAGDYIVLAWDSTRINEAYQTMSLEVAKTP